MRGFPDFDLCLQFHSLEKRIVNVISLEKSWKAAVSKPDSFTWARLSSSSPTRSSPSNLSWMPASLRTSEACAWLTKLHPDLEPGRSHLPPEGNILPSQLKRFGKNPSFSQIPKKKYAIPVTTWAQNFIQPLSPPTMICSRACTCQDQSQLL